MRLNTSKLDGHANYGRFVKMGPLPTWSYVYPNAINRLTPQHKRWWRGPMPNKSNDFGGWLFRIHHGSPIGPICGASYYSPYLLITSATCIQPYRYDLDGTSVEPAFNDDHAFNHHDRFGTIDHVYIPKHFTYFKSYQDIAIIRLEEPFSSHTAEFIKLCNRTIKDSMKMTAYAWGIDSHYVGLESSDTKTGIVPVENRLLCKAKFRGSDYEVSSTAFCVTHPRNARLCRYDGGCPLTYGRELCGVVSHGPMCSYPSQPGIYTDINKVAWFIKAIKHKVEHKHLREHGRSKRRKFYNKYRKRRRHKRKKYTL